MYRCYCTVNKNNCKWCSVFNKSLKTLKYIKMALIHSLIHRCLYSPLWALASTWFPSSTSDIRCRTPLERSQLMYNASTYTRQHKHRVKEQVYARLKPAIQCTSAQGPRPRPRCHWIGGVDRQWYNLRQCTVSGRSHAWPELRSIRTTQTRWQYASTPCSHL
jgi:hypothetical protein